jgi:hypothetical protein
MPSAWRRSANGSLSPVGSWPMANRPASVSSLSASATTTPTSLRGSASPAKRGGSGLRWRSRRRRPAVVARVVAAHDALQLGELADHVGQQVGLGQARGDIGVVRQLVAAQLRADHLGDGAHALDALALRAQLVVVHDLGQAGDARLQRLLAVLVEEELGIGQARAHHALVAADDRAGVLRADVADHQELVGELALRVQQREVLLVGLHREDQAFLRHREEFLSNWQVSTFGRSTSAVTSSSSASSSIGGAAADLAHALPAAGARSRRGARRSRRSRRRLRAAWRRSCRHPRCSPSAWPPRSGGRCVVRPACRPSACTGTTSLPCSATSAVRRAHELDVGPAVGQLVGHDLGDRQLGQAFLQRLLQAFGQRDAPCTVLS